MEGTKSLDSNAIEFLEKGINFVGRTFENNGVQGKIEKRDFEPNESNTITATVIGNYKYVKYQKEPYYCSQNINKLTPKEVINKWNEKIAYYFVANIQQFVSLYNGQQGGYKLEDIKNHKIRIPIKYNKIDFSFIEELILKLEKEKMLELEEHLSSNGLQDYNLTNQEKVALDNLEKRTWKKFKIEEILDWQKNISEINPLELDLLSVSSEQKYPFYGQSTVNNGIIEYRHLKEEVLNNKLAKSTILIHSNNQNTVYLETPFYLKDGHGATSVLQSEKLNKKIAFFLISSIKKVILQKYSYNAKATKIELKNTFIDLPIKEDNTPDYDYMNLVISAIQKLVIKNLVLYINKKTA